MTTKQHKSLNSWIILSRIYHKILGYPKALRPLIKPLYFQSRLFSSLTKVCLYKVDDKDKFKTKCSFLWYLHLFLPMPCNVLVSAEKITKLSDRNTPRSDFYSQEDLLPRGFTSPMAHSLTANNLLKILPKLKNLRVNLFSQQDYLIASQTIIACLSLGNSI